MTVKNEVELCYKYLNLYKRASDKGLDFNLTITSVRNLKKAKKCFYTGKPFGNKENVDALTIDRVDNSKGYVIGNVVACRADINHAKSNLSVEQILALAEGIKRKLGEK